MTKVRTTLLDIPDLESLDLKTESRDGKRHYIDSEGNAYPSVTTVCGLRLKNKSNYGENELVKKLQTKSLHPFARRGTSFHQHVEDYLRRKRVHRV